MQIVVSLEGSFNYVKNKRNWIMTKKLNLNDKNHTMNFLLYADIKIDFGHKEALGEDIGTIETASFFEKNEDFLFICAILFLSQYK